ncbi:MAG: glutamate/tyrosine decarboxylase-like PLP-dependent enzyme [Paraglaciecola sp.]|jgi:glutamate/tyrosine decarboxylase-like PLP-dependent enzyme
MNNNAFIEQGNAILYDIQNSHDRGVDAPIYRSELSMVELLNHPGDLPKQGMALHDVVAQAISGLSEGYANTQHPGFFAYISPKPDLASVLGDLLAAGHNQTSGAWRAGPFATAIERQVLHWLCQLTGFPAQSGSLPNGIITNGGAMANATALKLAREQTLGQNVKEEGLYGAGRLRFYGSVESHFSIHRSLDFLGMGKKNLVTLPCTAQGKMDTDILKKQIIADIEQGYLPCAVVALAGTTATGQVDPLEAIHQICQEHQLWMHVDGASGAVFAQLPETSQMFRGIEKADSVCIDPCKWLFQSFGIGCLLVRKAETLLHSFSISSHYWDDKEEPDFFQMGLSGTRQWRSLGLWFLFKTRGLTGVHKQLRHIRQCARHIDNTIGKLAFVEVLSHCELAVAVFRLKLKNDNASNDANKALQLWMLDNDQFFLSELEVDGNTWLRAAISNTSTQKTDIERLSAGVSSFYHSLNSVSKHSNKN